MECFIMDVVNAEQAKIAEEAGVRKLIQNLCGQINQFGLGGCFCGPRKSASVYLA